MNDAMSAEFDTVATWTADAAIALGPDLHLPAACRGSGSPAALQALITGLALTETDRMLDCGAGVGGPAAFAAQQTGVRPVLTDPETGACRAARRLFGLPTVRAGSELPFRDGSFDVAWSLGVLCTVSRQDLLLGELRRVLTPDGRLGLLVFVAATDDLPHQPDGNNFPTESALRSLLDEAQFAVETLVDADTFGAAPPDWQRRADAVDAEIDRRAHGDSSWRVARQQSDQIADLLGRGFLEPVLVRARPGGVSVGGNPRNTLRMKAQSNSAG